MKIQILSTILAAACVTSACGVAEKDSRLASASEAAVSEKVITLSTASGRVVSPPLPDSSPAKRMLGDYFGVNMMRRDCIVMVQQPVFVNPEGDLEIILSPAGEDIEVLAKTSFFSRPSGTLLYEIAPKNEQDFLTEVSLEWDESGLTSFSAVRWNHSSGAKRSVVSAHYCRPLVKE